MSSIVTFFFYILLLSVLKPHCQIQKVIFRLLHSQVDNCPNDYVEVLEGSYGSTDTIKRLCGANLPYRDEYRVVRSKGSSLLVHMHTDDANENRGFAASHQGE